MRASLLALALCAGCAMTPKRTVVTEARLVANRLVITKCAVWAENNELKMGDCYQLAQAIPGGAGEAACPAPAPPPTPAGIPDIHHALVQCARLLRVTGQMTIAVDVDEDGDLRSLSVDPPRSDLEACTAKALSSDNVAELRGRALQLPFVLQ